MKCNSEETRHGAKAAQTGNDPNGIVSVTNTVGGNFARLTHSAMNLSPRCADLWKIWLDSHRAAPQTASAVVIRANALPSCLPYGATTSYAMIFHFWFSFPHSNVSAAG